MTAEPFQPPPRHRLRIFARDDGSFDPTWPDDGAGVDALVVPVLDVGYREIDLVAWKPNDPNRWWLARREAQLLGDWQVSWADIKNHPVHLYATPAAWLTAVEGGDKFAVCLLDWKSRIQRTLIRAPRIECADAALAEMLRRTILTQSLPHFTIGVRAHA